MRIIASFRSIQGLVTGLYLEIQLGRTQRLKNPTFEESVKQALNRAIVAAPHQKGHATAQEAVLGAGNESVYVMVDCWMMTLSASFL